MTFCGAETTWLGCSGVGDRVREGVPAYPSLHLLCPQRVSLAPQIGPVVVAKRHRSSVAPHNAVSRDPSTSWAGMGCVGCPSARRQCRNLQSCRPVGAVGSGGAQLSPLGACALQPVSPCTHGDSIPGCAGQQGQGVGRAEPMGRHWSTVGLQPGMFSLPPTSAGECPPRAPSCRGPGPCQQPPARCSGAATPLSPGTSHLHACRSWEGLGKGAHGWCRTSFGVLPSRGREGICWGDTCAHHGRTGVLWTCQMSLSQGRWDATRAPWEVGSLPASQPGAGVVCLSGPPPLPSLSAELTTVWGTSEDLGCHVPGRESHTEGSSVGQPAPTPFPSSPRGFPPLQHQFTSKTVCVPASLPPLGCYGERSWAGGVGLGGTKLSSVSPPAALPARGMDGGGGGWFGEDEGVVLVICKKGGP